MAISRWDPFAEMARLQDQLFGSSGRGRQEGFLPAIDIFEDEQAIYVDAELPGVKADDVNIELDENVLTIAGERRFDREQQQGERRRIEHSYGSFTRSFVVPPSVDGERIQAEMKDGVLRLKLEKRAEAQKRRIPIGSSTRGEKGQGRIEQPKVRTQRDAEEKRQQEREAEEREAAE
jgi:HSP20 family protein